MLYLQEKYENRGEITVKYANPYTPGAGFMPGHLAGRKEILDEAEKYLKTLVLGYPQQSIIYYGLRGVGKTVLLNAIEEKTDELPVLMEHIEIAEKRNFTQQIANSCKKFIHKMSFKEAAKDFVNKAQGVLRAFTVTYNPSEQSFSVGVSDNEYIATGDLSDDMTDLFVSMGKMAGKTGYAICFFIDEIQYMKDEEVEALVNAVHRCNQLRLPIMVFGAGLPKIIKTLGKVKTYSERLFRFREIDALGKQDAKEAIVKPAEPLGVRYTNDSLERILNVTQGYPYFIQELCSAIWNDIEEEKDIIEEIHVERAIPKFFENLDLGFYKMRYDRCTHKEKIFIFAMVKCGDLPCTISNVAKIMNKDVRSISTYRAQLINKGVIYATGHAEIDFTVPGFDGYLKRINPELSIDFDN